MKPHLSRRLRGFTLVELLVVIAIIAVLAGAGFAAARAAIDKANKTTALATIIAIENGVNQFYSEYGALPTEDSTDGSEDAPPIDTGNNAKGQEFLNVMLGLDEGGASPLNTRGTKFMDVREGKAKGNKGTKGIIYNSTGKKALGLYDPWGGSYKVILDTGFDDRVDPKPKGGGGPQNPLNGRRVAAWSDGADGVDTTGKAIDDVKSW
jgi:prepilin-type N-terminal cleavage/methylation domain-containing protein